MSKNTVVIYPDFRVCYGDSNLMIKGKQFYAFFDEDTKMWTTNPTAVTRCIDKALREVAAEHPGAIVEYVDSFSSHKWKEFLDFTRSLPDNYHELDRNVMFANSDIQKEDYATKRLTYALGDGPMDHYNLLAKTLYFDEERQKFEWAIGAIATGAAKSIQKFLVFRGSPGAGKSTIINIISMLFDGYCGIFDAKALGNGNASFAMEPFAKNPLVAIQHDGDLSGIEDNTRLNSIIAHEALNVNEKFKSIYSTKFDSFLIMGTNKPVKITDSKSGIIRRLIDIYPSDNKLPYREYINCMDNIKLELGAIMQHCIDVFMELGPSFYDNYIPTKMISATNDMYNFLEDNLELYEEKDHTTLSEAWKLYNEWADDANVKYRYSKRIFKEELKEYFNEYKDQKVIDGIHIRGYYGGFRIQKFLGLIDDVNEVQDIIVDNDLPEWIRLTPHTTSNLDISLQNCLAQNAVVKDGTSFPRYPWAKCESHLIDVKPTQEHYVKVPTNLIVIDFDIPDENGEKSLEANLKAASNWPKTYCETSKSGKGIHLHYYYKGDVSQLNRLYADHIEIKVFTGGSALRRRLSLANDEDISTFTGSLPLKEAKQVVNWEGIQNERMLRTMITKNLNKEYHDFTKPSIDYIKELLDQAYDSGIQYDVRDMRAAVRTFAINSSHNSTYCLKLLNDMKWCSEEESPFKDFENDEIVFFDVEVFPNLFVVCYKRRNHPTQVLINPESTVIEQLVKYKLIGFNNRDYDNHILYARIMGYTNKQLYLLSKDIIAGEGVKFANAYNLSYTDIYDFCAEKMSLKKWEIKLGIIHMELGLDWDSPVPEELWDKVAEYCKNDVDSTEAVFDANIGDFKARQILADIANIFTGKNNSNENTKSNTLTARIIFGNNQNPQSEFIYTDLSKDFPGYEYNIFTGKSKYKGIETGEGGRVWAKPGMYYNAWTFDIAGMHPSSAFAMNIFGDRYTKQYKLIYDLRILIKHKEFEKAKELFDHKLDKYLDDPKLAKALSKALKIAINSVYGLTSAKFDNVFKDPRNVDNIVAKRGALFMIDLQEEVEKRGGDVIHIKTDSIKVVNPSKELVEFIMEYGKKWGYTFEVEHVFDRICLVNDAVYVAKLSDEDPEAPGEWTSTGTQFKVPYVFKSLFSKEDLIINDFFEVKESKAGTIFMDFCNDKEDVSKWEDLKEYRRKKAAGMKITKKAEVIIDEFKYLSDEDLEATIAKGHDYRFVGRVGCFIPIKKERGGAVLVAKNAKTGKYGALTGTKDTYWLEADSVIRRDDIWDILDRSYHEELARKAIETIEKFGSYDIFVSDNGTPIAC